MTREIQIFYDGGNSHCLFKTGVPAEPDVQIMVHPVILAASRFAGWQ
jgi:hypothetical protein